MTTTNTSRLASGTEQDQNGSYATPEQFAARLDRIKARNGNDQPHPDAGNPYEQIPAADLRDTDVFASGLAVASIKRDALLTRVNLADGSAYRYGHTNPVLIQRRTTDQVRAGQLCIGDVIVTASSSKRTVARVTISSTNEVAVNYSGPASPITTFHPAYEVVQIARRNGGA